MTYSLMLKTAPKVEPVSVDEIKVMLKIDDTAEDSLLSACIAAARQYCEDYQHRAFITQTWEMVMPHFPAGLITVPKGMLQTVNSITYRDAAGQLFELSDGDDYIYSVRGVLGTISPPYAKHWPVFVPWPVDAVTIEFTCGYGPEASDVPEKTRQAIKLLVAHWYANREPVLIGTVGRELEFTLSALLGQDRIMLV